jgi:hypothetical protein
VFSDFWSDCIPGTLAPTTFCFSTSEFAFVEQSIMELSRSYHVRVEEGRLTDGRLPPVSG